MAKLSDMIKKALSEDVSAVIAAPVATKAPKAEFNGARVAMPSVEADRVADYAFIVKSLRGGVLSAADSKDLTAKFKAVGVTTDIEALLPSGFSGTLIRDIENELNVAKLFPMGQINGGTAHDIIAINGITAYLTGENTDGTDSSEAYMTFVKTSKKIMAVVRKSYEAVNDSLVDLAAEVRYELVNAIAEGIEQAVINGDIAATHMDSGVASASSKKTCNGIRKHALGKATVDFGGAALTEAQMFAKIVEMQLAGGKYLSDMEVGKGNVALVVDNYTFSKFRLFDSFKTLDKAGNMATVFGGKVDSVFNIPVISTTLIPSVNASGVVSATGADNVYGTAVMVNTKMFKLFSNGSVVSESDKNVVNQTMLWTSSLRFGFAGIYDSAEGTPNTVNASYKTAVIGLKIVK